MADAVITTVVNQVVQIGVNLAVEAGSRLHRLPENIEWIERQLRHFGSCLKDAESKEAGSHEVANLIIEIRNLALDIEDALDTYLPEIASHKGKGPLQCLENVACISCYGATAHKFAVEIEKIQKRAEQIEAARERCGVIVDTGGSNSDAGIRDRRRRFLDAKELEIVGREETLHELEVRLLNGISPCEMICIVGDGGVGKTTVAKKIYTQFKDKFTCSAMVYVSQQPRLNDLLTEIAKQVGLGEDKRKENLEQNLRSWLEEKGHLFFLDDIWDIETWDDLKSIIPVNSRNGSKIIITSRYTDVGRYIGAESSLIQVKLLDEKMSWELFSMLMKPSSASNDGKIVEGELEDISRKIVERCCGLPLAIEVAVGMLRHKKRRKHEWMEVLESMTEGIHGGCKKILALSYKDLPLELRPLFLYFGLFPEDHEIFVSELTPAWVVEKLVHVNENQRLEDVVQCNLEKLIDRNLIQVSRRGLDGRIKSCRIHDVLRGFCIDKAKEIYFFCTLSNTDSKFVPVQRRLSINNDNFDQCFPSNYRALKLRALLCFSSKNHPNLAQNIKVILSVARFLRHLIIEVPGGFEGSSFSLPDDMGSLNRLTYLRLKGDFKRMPSSITNLKNLLTLNLQEAYFFFRPRVNVFLMKNVKHFLIKPYNSDFFICGYRFHGSSYSFHRSMHTSIETLHGMHGSYLKTSSLCKLTNLKRLYIKWVSDEQVDVISSTTPIMEKLESLKLLFLEMHQNQRLNLSLYRHLVRLRLCSYTGPSVCLDSIQFPPNLTKLSLVTFILNEDSMKVLKELPKLQILKFTHCTFRTKTLDCSGEHSFPQLQVIAIIRSDIKELIADELGMPKLSRIVYRSWNGMESIVMPERIYNLVDRN